MSSNCLHRACSKCTKFLDLIESLGEKIKSGDDCTLDELGGIILPLHNIESMIEESRDGCHLCSLILAEIGSSHQKTLLSYLHANRNHNQSLQASIDKNELGSLPGDGSADLMWDIQAPENYPGRDVRMPLGMVHFVRCESLRDGIKVPRITSAGATTGSEDTLRIIQYWLKKCESEHSECVKRRRKIGQLPTRLLSITASSGQSKIYLRESCHLPPDSIYMTLSYCWGPVSQQKRLLTGNYDSLCSNGLSIDDLPQTFQDAASVARDLGIGYF